MNRVERRQQAHTPIPLNQECTCEVEWSRVSVAPECMAHKTEPKYKNIVVLDRFKLFSNNT